jgi:hypothetical protein
LRIWSEFGSDGFNPFLEASSLNWLSLIIDFIFEVFEQAVKLIKESFIDVLGLVVGQNEYAFLRVVK